MLQMMAPMRVESMCMKSPAAARNVSSNPCKKAVSPEMSAVKNLPKREKISCASALLTMEFRLMVTMVYDTPKKRTPVTRLYSNTLKTRGKLSMMTCRELRNLISKVSPAADDVLAVEAVYRKIDGFHADTET